MKLLPCALCGAQFRVKRIWQQFCSEQCRNQHWVETNRKRKADGNPDPCFYCGIVANSIDHVPPQSARERLTELNLMDKYPYIEVPACRECNSALGARGIWLLPKRKEYIKRYLRRKYKKYLRMSDWSDEEIKELGFALQSHVLNGIMIKEQTKKRISW